MSLLHMTVVKFIQVNNITRIIVAYIIQQFNTNFWKDNVKQFLVQKKVEEKEEHPNPQRLVATAVRKLSGSNDGQA